nr:carboxyltransferase domain-containing protein [Pyrinomonadaceae bacterium]
MRIFPLGDSAATIEFGNEISAEFNNKAVNLARQIENTPFDRIIEAVPAYASLTVFYDSRLTTFE